ncbi:hypothetical protein GC173_13495 [bacterium]|nr:hypothetical protein [bacterium]
MARAKRDVEASLLAKGFEQREGDHSYFVYHAADGKKSMARTKTSHGTSSRELGDELLGMMSKQCGLTKKQFLDLVDCPLGREEYEGILRGVGKL